MPASRPAAEVPSPGRSTLTGGGPAGAPFAETARAKVNLALHVVGRRPDGYHLLDTLVVFPAIGDRLTLVPRAEPGIGLTVSGPGAAALAALPASDNLVCRAFRLAARTAGRSLEADGLTVHLDKHLPVEAGIGGGSADAAAALRLAARLYGLDPSAPALLDAAASLGADVPMCLVSRPLRARGIGEAIEPLGSLPRAGILLANPGVALSTPAVFRALERRDNSPLGHLGDLSDYDTLLAVLRASRNDLEPPAGALVPAIGILLDDLRTLPGADLCRMSGSGTTCFALFATAAAAEAAATILRAARPDLWIAAAAVG